MYNFVISYFIRDKEYLGNVWKGLFKIRDIG